MFQSNCYNIMIVSPSDVMQERIMIRDLINEWNYIHGQTRKIILLPLGWEINAYPASGEHPQDILNHQLLEKADIIVGVFWTRIGTETESYASGTVEEITKHTDNGKPALIYFSTAPVVPDSIDLEQYAKLKIYKNSISKKSFYRQYANIAELGSIFSNHLNLLVNDSLESYSEVVPSFQIESQQVDEKSYKLSQLSDLAKELIKEVSKDRGGSLLKSRFIGGFSVQTNQKEFGSRTRDPRREALLEEAIQQLELHDLINAATSKRDFFRITASGYTIAEAIPDSKTIAE